MDIQEAIEACGFECVGTCSASELRTLEAVREMCASGRCQAYGTNWACPPHCGSLEDFQEAFGERSQCWVLQTVMELEDEFDGETMMEAAQVHQARIHKLSQLVSGMPGNSPDAILLTAGACTICPRCTCPEEPCRFPEKKLVSMESAGLMVNDVCVSAGIPYNHGKGRIAYTGCVVL